MVNQKTFTRGILAFVLSCIILISNMMYVKADFVLPTSGSGLYYNQNGPQIVMGEEYNFTLSARSGIMQLTDYIKSDKTYWINIYTDFNLVFIDMPNVVINNVKRYICFANHKIEINNGWSNFNITGVLTNQFYFYTEVDVYIPSSNNVSDSSLTFNDNYSWTIYNINEVQTVEDKINTGIDRGNQLQEESNQTSKGIFNKITDFFNGFFDNLGNTVLSWIVPTAEQLTEFLNDVNAWFSDRLGFIWYPFSLAIDMVTAFAGGDSSSTFNVPALELTLMGNKYKIWDSMTIDMDAFDIFKYVRYFTSVILVAGVVKLAYDKWDEWIGGHGVG